MAIEKLQSNYKKKKKHWIISQINKTGNAHIS